MVPPVKWIPFFCKPVDEIHEFPDGYYRSIPRHDPWDCQSGLPISPGVVFLGVDLWGSPAWQSQVRVVGLGYRQNPLSDLHGDASSSERSYDLSGANRSERSGFLRFRFPSLPFDPDFTRSLKLLEKELLCCDSTHYNRSIYRSMVIGSVWKPRALIQALQETRNKPPCSPKAQQVPLEHRWS